MEFLLANDPLSFRNNNQGTDVVLMQWLSELCRNRKWTTREEIHRTIKMIETLCSGDDDKSDSKLRWALLGKIYEKAQRSLTMISSSLAGSVLYPAKHSPTQKAIMEYQMFWILVHAFPRILCLSSCQPKFLVKNWKEFLDWISGVNSSERTSFSIGSFLRQQRSASDIADLVHQVEGKIMKLIACYQQHKQEHRHEYLDPFLGAIPGHRHGRTFSDGGIRPAGAGGGLF